MARGVYRRPLHRYYQRRVLSTRRRFVGGVAQSYDLTADQGSYTLTGANATLTSQRSLTADQGSYSLAGADATLTSQRSLTAAQGSYTLTGADATLTAGASLTAAQGAYTLTGADATLTAQRSLTAAQGSYTLTGADAALTAQRSLTADQGSYALTGAAATLTAQRSLTADQGSYTLTGDAAALTAQRSLTADQGSYTLTGADVTFTTGYGLVAAQGSYTLTGAAATLTSQRQLTAAQGSYALTGADVTLTYFIPVGSQSFPSWVVHFEKTKPTTYSIRAPPQHDEWTQTATTPAVYPSFVTHFEKTKRTRFNLRVLPQHDQWTQTATFAAVMPSFVTHFEPTRNRTNHRRVDVPHNEWTQAVTTPAVYPSFVTHFERTRNVTNHRRLDVVLSTFEPPPTPPADIIIGSVPAFITRTIASRKHRYVSIFPDYGDPVAADAAVYPSFVQWGSHKFGFSIRRQILKTDADRLADVVTDPVQDEEEFPAWLPPKANRVTFTRRRRELPSFEDWANAQASTDAAVVGAIFRPEFRRRRKAPELTVVYSDIILADKAQDVFLAPYVPRPVAFRRVGKRRHLAAPEMAPIAADNPPPTTAAVYPAFVPPPTLRREYRVTLRRAPDPVDLPVVQIDEPLANVLVKVVPRRRTQRRLVLPLPIVGASSEAAPLDEPFVATVLNRSTRQRFIYNRKVSVLGYPGEALPEFKCDVYLQGAITETIYLSAAIRSDVTYVGVAGGLSEGVYVQVGMSDEVHVRTSIKPKVSYFRTEMC